MAKKTKAKQEKEVPKATKKEGVPILSISAGDPFVDGVVRHIGKAEEKSRIDVNARPLVIPAVDPVALSAVENYIVRAAGAGDTKRADSARQALAAFKAFAEK